MWPRPNGTRHGTVSDQILSIVFVTVTVRISISKFITCHHEMFSSVKLHFLFLSLCAWMCRHDGADTIQQRSFKTNQSRQQG